MPTHDVVITGSHVLVSESAPRMSRLQQTPDVISDVNIVIDDGVISDITCDIPPADLKIDGSGLVSVPGLVDTHVHYGVYSPIDKSARTESHAAAIGGVTTMMRMLRLPHPFESSLPAQLDAMSRNHYVDYAIHASVFTSEQINGMQYCVDNNVNSFKIYMNLGGDVGHVYMDMPPMSDDLVPSHVDVNDDIVRNTVKEAARLGCPVLVHAEDYEMCGCGIKTAQEKKLDGLSAWSDSRPPESEAKAIRTVSGFGREYGCVIYFVHVGSASALRQIRKEQRLGTRIFVETCPHYLALSHEDQHGYLAKVMPPIRTRSDCDAVWGAIADGTINTIGTDHVANQLDLKLGGDDVWGALAGFPGIGTSAPILLHRGVNAGRMTLGEFARATSCGAAAIFGLRGKGAIAVGYDADITMIDLKLEKEVSSDLFGGFSDYTVYEGMRLTGWPVKTLVRGSVVCDEFKVTGKMGHGRMVGRSTQ